MQDTNAPLSGLATQDIIMQGPDVPYPELYSMPGPSSDINMHQPAIPALPLNQPFTSGLYAVWGKEKITIHRSWYVFRLAMMERLAKERITRSIVSLLRYVL